MLWGGAGLFGLSALYPVMALMKGASLILMPGGFDIRSWKRRSVRWRDVGGFEVYTIPPSDVPAVIFDDAAASGGRLAAANVAITGRNSALPDGYRLAH